MRIAVVILAFLTSSAQAGELARRTATLDELRRVLPRVDAFEEWLDKSGELPPDFAKMPSVPGLPPLLSDAQGSAVSTPAGWRVRREHLLEEVKRYIAGSVPPAPGNLSATVLSESEMEATIHREVELRFGPGLKAKLWMELFIPAGEGPFPVFMTQENHRGWAQIAVRRGYMGVVYAGADTRDDTPTFLDAYPGYDWSKLTRRGWAAGRCIDYLESIPQADTKRIVLTGHSRNGKSSLIGSALDERIACVISSSSGAGGCNPARYFGEEQFGEGIELITRGFPDWFTPRFRFFAGREDKLPVDMHTLVALSAPRPCLLAVALNDNVESTWAVQETYKAVKPVYLLHDAGERFRICWRPGGHETSAAIIETYLDWCDKQFGRGQADFPERFVYPVIDKGEDISTPALPLGGTPSPLTRDALAAAVRAMLGDAPPNTPPVVSEYGKEPAHVATLLGRNAPLDGIVRKSLVFGEYIDGDLYLPGESADKTDASVPVVLWLHPVSNAKGYSASYIRGQQPYLTFAKAGYAVFCFDQIGSGRRVEEAEHFYRRHPGWSLMGKTLRDAQDALDAIAMQPQLDPSRVYVAGFALGATVALHLAAVDDRPAGYAIVAPPAPFRLDLAGTPYGGIARWAVDLALVPRLTGYLGSEHAIPYDLTDCMAAMAPKPLLLVTPSLGRETPAYHRNGTLRPVKEAYRSADAGSEFVHASPETYVHFDSSNQQLVLDWLNRIGQAGRAK